MTPAISSGRPRRPSGWIASLATRDTSDRNSGAAGGISVGAGATALNRIPRRAYVIADDRTIPSIAPLAATIISCGFRNEDVHDPSGHRDSSLNPPHFGAYLFI